MASAKFDESDRKKVIAQLESYYDVMLFQPSSHRKSLRDENDMSYWVFGGYGDWHGISPDMMKEAQTGNGKLVVVKRYRDHIDIFVGALQPMVANKESLAHTQTGYFHFNIKVRGNHLFIKEVPSLVLSKISKISYMRDTKSKEKALKEWGKLTVGLSADDKRSLLREALANK